MAESYEKAIEVMSDEDLIEEMRMVNDRLNMLKAKENYLVSNEELESLEYKKNLCAKVLSMRKESSNNISEATAKFAKFVEVMLQEMMIYAVEAAQDGHRRTIKEYPGYVPPEKFIERQDCFQTEKKYIDLLNGLINSFNENYNHYCNAKPDDFMDDIIKSKKDLVDIINSEIIRGISYLTIYNVKFCQYYNNNKRHTMYSLDSDQRAAYNKIDSLIQDLIDVRINFEPIIRASGLLC